MSDPLVTFVVLSYNFEPFIGECVESILGQEGGYDFEVVAIDDASTDGSASVLKGFTDPRIRVVVHEQNQGHARTVNEALALARGRYIARIDGDDRYRPGFLASVVPILEHHPEVGLVYGDAALMDASGRINSTASDRVHGGREHKGNELVALLEQNFICAPTIIARREAWLSCLPVPEWLAFHDWYFTVLIARRWPFFFVNRVLADYRVHGGNHHTRIILNKTEEPSIMWMLGRVFNEPESDVALERAKRRARSRIYGRHYLTLAEKYFGAGFNDDARRCYWQAIWYRPGVLADVGVDRRFAATLIGRRRYEIGKAWLKGALSRQ